MIRNEYRIWTIEELKKAPVGTKFMHESLGEGEIVEKGQVFSVRFMQWKDDHQPPAGFIAQKYPWDGKMKMV